MFPQKIFKIRIFNLAENEFRTTKFPGFSPTLGILSQISWLFRQIPWLSGVAFEFRLLQIFQVFQVSGNPATFMKWFAITLTWTYSSKHSKIFDNQGNVGLRQFAGIILFNFSLKTCHWPYFTRGPKVYSHIRVGPQGDSAPICISGVSQPEH